jgi:hypothetical protein
MDSVLKGFIVGGMVIVGEVVVAIGSVGTETKDMILNPRQAQILFYPKGQDAQNNPIFDNVTAMNPLPGSPSSIAIDPSWPSYDFSESDVATVNLYKRVTNPGIHAVK